MKLKKFIRDLEKISSKAEHPDVVEVQMADCTPVVKPIFKDGTVYITDIDQDTEED